MHQSSKFSGWQMNMNPQTPRPLRGLPPANRRSFGNHALGNPRGSLRIACPQTESHLYLRRREDQQLPAEECCKPSFHGLHQPWFREFARYSIEIPRLLSLWWFWCTYCFSSAAIGLCDTHAKPVVSFTSTMVSHTENWDELLMTMPPLSTLPLPGEHVQDHLQHRVLCFENTCWKMWTACPPRFQNSKLILCCSLRLWLRLCAMPLGVSGSFLIIQNGIVQCLGLCADLVFINRPSGNQPLQRHAPRINRDKITASVLHQSINHRGRP